MDRRTRTGALRFVCAAALAALPRHAAAQLTLEQVGALFTAGVRIDAVISTLRTKCLAFRLGPDEEQALAGRGASSRDLAQLRRVCVAGMPPAASESAPAPVPAALPAEPEFVPDTTWQPVRVLEADTVSDAVRHERTRSRLLDEGARAFHAGELDAAFRAWDELLAVDPTAVALLINRAVAEDAAGRGSAAVATFRRLYEAAPTAGLPADSAATLKAQGLAGMLWAAGRLGERGDRAGQKAALRQVLEIDDGNAFALGSLPALAYSGHEWTELLPLLDRLDALYPLDYDQRMMRYAAYRALGEAGGSDPAGAAGYRDQAARAVAAANALPLRLRHLRFEQAGDTATVRGELAAGSLPPGATLVVELTYTDPRGVVARQTVSLSAPSPGASVPFSASLVSAAPTGFRYRVLQAGQL